MTDLAIITPSRGRPRQFAEMVTAVSATATGSVHIYAGLDDDDPSDYAVTLAVGRTQVRVIPGPRRSLSGWTNHLAKLALESPDPPRYLASLGDDHRPRTSAWDRRLIDAIERLGGSGFAYGNDLLQGEAMPTAWVVSADIVQALGWMMLPTCEHMYVDNVILELGRAAGRITYCPDVIVEHVHPLAGKTAWDQSYRESNAPARYAADGTAFAAWKASGLAADVERVLALTPGLDVRAVAVK